jgi:outer membrane protein assembly factor BamB
VWNWKSPKGTGFVAVLLDGDRVIASAQGYTYCLDALSGEQLWSNPLKGMGLGIPMMVSMRGNSGSAGAAAIIAQQQAAAAAGA